MIRPLSFNALVTSLAVAVAGSVYAANWQPIATYQDERVEIDRTRIARVGAGRTLAWSRLVLARELALAGSKESYSVVEALNRYDCERRTFVTVKRVFLRESKLVRQEAVAAPKEMAAEAGSVDEQLLREACKLRTVSEMKKVAEAAARSVGESSAPAKAEAPPRPLRISFRGASEPDASPRGAETIPDAFAARKKRGKAASVAELAQKRLPWSYEGEGGPSNWDKLRSEFSLCATGKRQSPIDIEDGLRLDLEPIKFDYKPTAFGIVNDGHTVEVTLGAGSSMTLLGRRYELMQLHFHHPAEERIAGRSYEMAAHLVHMDDEGRQAIVTVLFELGSAQPIVQTLWNNLPLEVGDYVSPEASVDTTRLLPERRDYYAYMGSLTTPPCTEGVLWLVLKQAVPIAPEQLAIFSRLYPNNARPLQAANKRLIKESR